MTSDAAIQETETPKWRLAFRVFRGALTTWQCLFNEAAEFASELGPERVVSISHSEDANDGVVAVWFWTHDDDTA